MADSWALTVLAALLAVALDLWLGEPRRYHPLVGFGAVANSAERWLRREGAVWQQRVSGGVALLLITLPFVLLAMLLSLNPWLELVGSVVLCYAAIGHRSLRDHVLPIADAIEQGDDDQARYHASMIVSRDPATMDVPRSTVESALENGSDGIFAALFWFLLAGAPGVVAYRLVNTLDAMWGYKTERFLHFGWAAAMLDDLMNYLPARLTAFSYALLGRTGQALRCWRQQAPLCSSPNGGPVMCAGAGALNLTLGGPTRYQGQWQDKPILGAGNDPQPCDIRRSINLVSRTLLLWLLVLIASMPLAGLLFGSVPIGGAL